MGIENQGDTKTTGKEQTILYRESKDGKVPSNRSDFKGVQTPKQKEAIMAKKNTRHVRDLDEATQVDTTELLKDADKARRNQSEIVFVGVFGQLRQYLKELERKDNVKIAYDSRETDPALKEIRAEKQEEGKKTGTSASNPELSVSL